jgi:hypothetical protein
LKRFLYILSLFVVLAFMSGGAAAEGIANEAPLAAGSYPTFIQSASSANPSSSSASTITLAYSMQNITVGSALWAYVVWSGVTDYPAASDSVNGNWNLVQWEYNSTYNVGIAGFLLPYSEGGSKPAVTVTFPGGNKTYLGLQVFEIGPSAGSMVVPIAIAGANDQVSPGTSANAIASGVVNTVGNGNTNALIVSATAAVKNKTNQPAAGTWPLAWSNRGGFSSGIPTRAETATLGSPQSVNADFTAVDGADEYMTIAMAFGSSASTPFTQANMVASNSGSVSGASYFKNNTPGSTLICVVWSEAYGVSSPSGDVVVSDSVNGTWNTLNTNYYNYKKNANEYLGLFWVRNKSSSKVNVSVSYSALKWTPIDGYVQVEEYYKSGYVIAPDGSTALTNSAISGNTYTTANSLVTITGATLRPSQNGDLIWSWFGDDPSSSVNNTPDVIGPGAGFSTAYPDQYGSGYAGTEVMVQGTKADIAPTVSFSANYEPVQWTMISQAFTVNRLQESSIAMSGGAVDGGSFGVSENPAGHNIYKGPMSGSCYPSRRSPVTRFLFITTTCPFFRCRIIRFHSYLIQ